MNPKLLVALFGLALAHVSYGERTPVPYPQEASDLLNLTLKCRAQLDEAMKNAEHVGVEVSREVIDGDTSTYYTLTTTSGGTAPFFHTTAVATFTITVTEKSEQHANPARDAGNRSVDCGEVSYMK